MPRSRRSASGRLPRDRGSDPTGAPRPPAGEGAFGCGAGGAVSHDAAGDFATPARPSGRGPGPPATRGTAAGLPLERQAAATGPRLGGALRTVLGTKARRAREVSRRDVMYTVRLTRLSVWRSDLRAWRAALESRLPRCRPYHGHRSCRECDGVKWRDTDDESLGRRGR